MTCFRLGCASQTVGDVPSSSTPKSLRLGLLLALLVIAGCGPRLALLDLQAEGAVFLPAFDRDQLSYLFAVPNGVVNATLEVSAEDSEAVVTATLDGSPVDLTVQPVILSLPPDDSILQVVVEKADKQSTYRVEIRHVGMSTSYTQLDLAGHSLEAYPFFETVKAFNEGVPFEVAFDPFDHPLLSHHTCDLYILANRSAAEWASDPSLTDVRPSGATTHSFGDLFDIRDTTILVEDLLNGTRTDGGLGVGYDLVLDCDQDGQLSSADLVDGVGDEAGMFVVHDTTAPGPFAVVSDDYELPGLPYGAPNQMTVYPSDIPAGTKLPLIVISHGFGHDYHWYDHIQNHLASYGYIVMSHQAQPMGDDKVAKFGELTMAHTDALLEHQDTFPDADGDGVGDLDGKIDSNRIVWIGHSRGGGGIGYAYRRLLDGTFQPTHYTADDIKLLVGVAPFIDRFNVYEPLPTSVAYHVFVGSADADVSNDHFSTPVYADHEQALGERTAMSIHGAGHGAFHNGGGSLVAAGPCLLSRPVVHTLMRGYLLPLVKYHLEGNVPAEDFLWRQWEEFRPPGIPPHNESGCKITVNLTHRKAPVDRLVIDDHQGQVCPEDEFTSSSGGPVVFSVDNLVEGGLWDGDYVLQWREDGVERCEMAPCLPMPNGCTDYLCGYAGGGQCLSMPDAMNGMFYSHYQIDEDGTRGVVFDWGAARYYGLYMAPGVRDFSEYSYLSLRATQGTRHPYTLQNMSDPNVDDLTFTVVLYDELGHSARINIGAYGGGVEQPYPRMRTYTVPGWSNEFETIRLRLRDFQRHNTGLDLSRISAVFLQFGGNSGTPRGRIGITDIELVK